MANLNTSSISSLNGFVEASPLDNFGTAGIIIDGTWNGTITFQGSLDGNNYVSILTQKIDGTLLTSTTTSNGQFLVNIAGLISIRAIMTSYSSGTANVIIQSNAAPFLQRSISTISGAANGTFIGNIDDNLQITGKSKVSSLNSTSVPLISNATFTGLFEEVLGYSMISVLINTDQDSAINGLEIGWSTDGINIDDTDRFTISANNTKQFTFGTVSQYFRIKYTNGNTNQSNFKLSVIYHPFGRKGSSHRISDSIIEQDDAELVKGIITAKDTGTNIFKNVTATNDRLNVNATLTDVVNNYNAYLLDLNAIYCASFLVNAETSGNDNPVVLFKNPSNSGKKIYFLEATGNAVISNERTVFKIFENPTVSNNGTSFTPKPRNVGNSAPLAKALTYSLPTISNNGNILSVTGSGENTNSQPFTSIQQLAIQPNNLLLITASPKSNNRVQAITIVWAELNL